MNDPIEAHALINLAELPDGSIAMNLIYEGGFNKRNKAHIIALKIDNWLKENSTAVNFETINGEDVAPTTLPLPGL